MNKGTDKIAELERQWKHASEVALTSIGQSDRVENVKYRDELEARLHTARAETISKDLHTELSKEPGWPRLPCNCPCTICAGQGTHCNSSYCIK